MRVLTLTTILIAYGVAQPALAQTSVDPWWPSQWGSDDERGAINRITAGKVIQAASLIRDGQIYELGRDYEAGMPLFPGRHFSLSIQGSPTFGPVGKNQTVWHVEMITGELGQVGTQFDGLGHVGSRVGEEDIFYNGYKRAEISTAFGLSKLGVEKVGAFFTRGVLIDVAAYKNVERLNVGQVITVEDLQGSLKRQNTELREGDVVLIRTGHGQLWNQDNDSYNRGSPGIGLEAAVWLANQRVVMTGGDTFSVEVVPFEEPGTNFPVHQELIGKRGIYNLENLNLEGLATDQVYEFAFVFAPVKFKGGTGSPGNPIAIR